ncbi:uncharacterized protein LOC135482929 [Lineus longissimus]|uniref:uncharacterized protein LOC135482929 n=1 Tax=Lineus longissimus TaxID=88925 RepID=UPI00315CEFC8
MSKLEERQFMLTCIELYRELPALWKVKSKEYSDRNKKDAAYQTLLEKYRKRYPKASRDDLTKKLNSLRTNYRKELNKVQQSSKSGAGTDEVYESTLWYFDAMDFLQDQETPSKSLSSIRIGAEAELSEEDEDDLVEVVTKAPTTSVSKPNKRRKTTKTDNGDQREELLSLACKRLNQPDNENMPIAKAWASELSKMNPSPQLLAKKAINEILFEGQMGTLNRYSVQINASLDRQTPYYSVPAGINTPNSIPSSSYGLANSRPSSPYSYSSSRPGTPYNIVGGNSVTPQGLDKSGSFRCQVIDEPDGVNISQSPLGHYFANFQP